MMMVVMMKMMKMMMMMMMMTNGRCCQTKPAGEPEVGSQCFAMRGAPHVTS